MEIQVRESFKVNVAQYESRDLEVLVRATHHDLGFSDDELAKLGSEEFDKLVTGLHELVAKEIRSELLLRLPALDSVSNSSDNLAARALAILSPAKRKK
jgi:hypothetical protein